MRRLPYFSHSISIHVLREEDDRRAVSAASSDIDISIHVLREEDDYQFIDQHIIRWNFYPRPPRGGRRNPPTVHITLCLRFLSTSSARRTTSGGTRRHAKGGFLSTSSARRTTFLGHPGSRGQIISIHVLREEDDQPPPKPPHPSMPNFYPRPPRGGRRYFSEGMADGILFLSTSSARRTTTRTGCWPNTRRYFYPRPPRGGRHAQRQSRLGRLPISIHVLREEDDPLTVLDCFSMD